MGRRLGLGQRVVLVIAFGAALVALGGFIDAWAAGGSAQFGWFGYAPLTRSIQSFGATGLTNWEQLLLWLGLILVWASGSILLLRPPPKPDAATYIGEL